ncbi:T9SS type A sorting domain-containing protein [Hymenobacter sp. BT635]|uniref:T9SS type A sorting domain-containing protein n=1 Tax=Hymenobacter nitidus TaxID=2880929 RepID=A0ABS8AJH9_9BACT|nr:T9SS type A sorting domain-containing protein [Hymenobacter nitidus]MCB2380507.1 T9SS type A sorting domain-containing protein [Hymenobacter nitidus]
MAQAPAKLWDKTFGGNAEEAVSAPFQFGASALEPTADGGYILGCASRSGSSGDKTQPSQGGSDYWVIKIDANGNKLWDKAFGGSDSDWLTTLQVTADGGYILGGYSMSGISGDKTQPNVGGYDYWVVKLDANGNKLWDKTFGGNDIDQLVALRVTPDGGYILGGYSMSNSSGDKTQNSQGELDYWLVKLDAAGNKLWDKTLGSRSIDVLTALLVTTDGGYIVGGNTDVPGVSGDKTQDGAYDDFWLVKLDATGTKQWDKVIGTTLTDKMYALTKTRDGGYLVGGYSPFSIPNARAIDFWTVKLDAAGNRQWQTYIGGAGTDIVLNLQQDQDDGYLMAGVSNANAFYDKTQPPRGNDDYWLVKTDAAGNKRWDLTLGGSEYETPHVVRLTPDGGYILSGKSSSGSSGDKTQPGRGSSDLWVVKLGGTLTPTAQAAPRHSLSVWPNPAHNRLTLRLPESVPRLGLHLTLLGATGRVAFSQALPITASADIPVEIGAQPAGLYLVRLVGPGGYLATQRLVVQ